MSGFGTIDDLLKQSQPAPQAGGVASDDNAPVQQDSVAEAFQRKMKEVGAMELEVEAQRKAAQLGVEYLNLEKYALSQAALRMLPKERAKALGVVPLYVNDEQFRLGFIDGSGEQANALKEEFAAAGKGNGQLYFISQKSFEKVMALYNTLPTVEAVNKDVSIDPVQLEQVKEAVKDFSSLQTLLEQQRTTDLVTFIMGAGMKVGASDIHIEAEETGIHLRFRIDGVLQDAAMLDKNKFKLLVSRLKLLSSLKINVTERPQDGRFAVKHPDGDIDIRVSTIPTIYGESVVMRLLVQRSTPLTLEELGIRGKALAVLKEEIGKPNGMIITTGPTGSGKTTSLYSIMYLLNKPGVKIITLEDPVEYKMEGINQSQIDKSKEYTFAKGLRSMLRQDPDIAMVGEIRDLETADIAVQASLTGHLMLSTLHTNNAFGAIPRFLAMGVKPFLLAPALNCVMGQRLVRRLDPEKKVPALLTPEQEATVNEAIEGLPEEYRAEIANKPRQFFTTPESDDEMEGFKGRIGIYEVIQVTDDVEQNILAGNVSEQAVREIAKKQGTITMLQDGIMKALDGETSVDEVLRVIR